VEALFGGSFDPVHLGHLIVAEAAADALGMRVRFVPAREQPLKRAAHAATPEQRTAMLEAAIAGNPRFSLERIELELPTPSYTVRTLRALAEREPGNRFVLLVGGDAVRELPSWHDVEALPGLADLVAFERPGAPVPAHGMIGRRVAVPALDISATGVRELVAQGRSIRYLVPDAVCEYIATHGLYR
jgi:nicotinate-nucleotide adenylyltransferase